jgi:uncharacterized membrane protein
MTLSAFYIFGAVICAFWFIDFLLNDPDRVQVGKADALAGTIMVVLWPLMPISVAIDIYNHLRTKRRWK